MIRAPVDVASISRRLLFVLNVFNMSIQLNDRIGVFDMSIQDNKKRVGNPPFQFRLSPELRLAIEKAVAQDGDGNISAWIKRIIRKELSSRGIDPKE